MDIETLKQRVDIVTVVAQYRKLVKQGSEYTASCFWHGPDENPSMSVIPAKQFVYCHACGIHGDIVDVVAAAEGISKSAAIKKIATTTYSEPVMVRSSRPSLGDRLTAKPPAAESRPKSFAIANLGGEPERIHTICDMDGTPLGYETIYRKDDKKEPRIWTWGHRANLPHEWGMGNFVTPRPLFGLETLATPGSVFISEGPKKAIAIGEMTEAPSVSILNGANSWHKHNWEPLRAKTCIIWPDADKIGIECAEKIGQMLLALDCRVFVMDVSAYKNGWDAFDAQQDGWDREQCREWVRTNLKKVEKSDTPELIDNSPTPETINDLPTPESETNSDATPESESESELVSNCHTLKPAIEAEPLHKSPYAEQQATRKKLTVIEGNTARQVEAQDEPLPASMSEDWLAFKMVKEKGDSWRFVYQTRTWYAFRQGNWHETTQAEIDNLCIGWTREAQYWPEAGMLTPGEKRKISQRRTAGAIRDIFGCADVVRSEPQDWDADNWLLGTPAGVVDLRTGRLSPTRKDQHITKRTAVAPDDSKDCPVWYSLLDFITCGDATMQGYLQRWAGYCCTGDTSEQAFAFLIGGGANGKGTFLTAIRECLGTYARIMRDDTIMAQGMQQHTQELAVLDGLRLAVVDETDGSKRFNEARIKAMTGGAPIVARKMRADDYEFPMRAKILIAGNERPAVRGTGKAMARRMHIIPFMATVADDQKDVHLSDKLRAEYPAILAWMIRGCLEWQQFSLGTIEAVSTATRDYLEGEDTLGAWIEDRTRISEGRADAAEMFRDYLQWAEAEGHHAWSRRAWANAMMQRGMKHLKSNGRTYYIGIELKEKPDTRPGFRGKNEWID